MDVFEAAAQGDVFVGSAVILVNSSGLLALCHMYVLMHLLCVRSHFINCLHSSKLHSQATLACNMHVT